MVKFYEKAHVYDSSWKDVTSAFWIKYPNEQQKHVKTVDTVKRELDTENQVLMQRRLMNLEYNMPSWMEKVFNQKMHGMAQEDSKVDLKNRTLELHGRNLSLSNYLELTEYCRYEVDPEDENKTLYTTSLSAKVKLPTGMNGFGLQTLLESKLIANAEAKAKGGWEMMTNKIEESKKVYEREEWDKFLDEMKQKREDQILKIEHKMEDLSHYAGEKSMELRNRILTAADIFKKQTSVVESLAAKSADFALAEAVPLNNNSSSCSSSSPSTVLPPEGYVEEAHRYSSENYYSDSSTTSDNLREALLQQAEQVKRNAEHMKMEVENVKQQAENIAKTESIPFFRRMRNLLGGLPK